MKPWSTRIPAAIADGEKLLDGGEYVLIPPHIGGNDTKLTLVLTAGEVAMAERMAELYEMGLVYEVTAAGNVPDRTLVAFCEKLEGLNHD